MVDIFGASGIAAVVIPFVVQLLKKLPFIGNKHAPILAFVIGAASGVIANLTGVVDLSLIQSVLAGVAVGGTSTGLYDLAKKETE